MATWAAVHANFPDTLNCLTDGVNIYGVNSIIEKYEPLSGDAVTTIGSGPETGSTTAFGDPINQLAWFKNKLYSVTIDQYPQYDSRLEINCYRWDGSGWTLVEQINPTSIDADSAVTGFVEPADIDLLYLRFYTPSFFVIIIEAREAFPGSGRVLYARYTQDGSTWNTAVLSIGFTDNGGGQDNYHSHLAGAFVEQDTATDKVYEFDGSAFILRNSSFGTDILDVIDNKYLWARNSVSTAYKYSSDGGITFTSPSDTAVTPISNNTVLPIAIKISAGTMYLKLWDPVGIDWLAATTEVIHGSATSADNFIRLNNGDSFIHVYDVGVGIWRTRSDPLGGPGRPDEEDVYDPGQFYYGRGNLIRRSDAPIPGTNLGGMALVGKKLFAGSIVNNSPMVAYAQMPTYEDWTDYTGTLSLTAPIKSFSATPWGDSEDLEGSEEGIEGGFQGGTGGQCS